MSVSVVITLALSLVPLLAAFSSLHAVSPQDKFEELIREEGGLATDTSKEEGKYVLAVAAVYLASGTDMSRTLETARMMAQRDLAAFLDGSSVSVEEESRTEISGKEIKDFFSSVVQTEVKHVLRMANVLDTRVKDDLLFAGFIMSEKRAKEFVQFSGMPKPPPPKWDVEEGERRNPFIAPAGALPESFQVEAVGIATVNGGGVPDARRNAKANARRNAIEHALGVTMVATGQMVDLDPSSSKFRNFSNAVGRVLNDKVIEEGPEDAKKGELYKVRIAANVTAADFGKEFSKFMVALQNPGFYLNQDSGPELTDEFAIFFRNIGFKLTTRTADPDYVIRIRPKFLKRVHPTRRTEGVQLSLTVEISDPINAKILLTSKNDPRLSTSFLGDPDRNRQISAEKAMRSMKKPLTKKIGKLIHDMLQNGREVEIAFQGLPVNGGEFLDATIRHLEWMPGVSEAQGKFDAGGRRTIFTCRYVGSMDLLRNTVVAKTKKKFPGTRLELNRQSANRIEFVLR